MVAESRELQSIYTLDTTNGSLLSVHVKRIEKVDSGVQMDNNSYQNFKPTLRGARRWACEWSCGLTHCARNHEHDIVPDPPAPLVPPLVTCIARAQWLKGKPADGHGRVHSSSRATLVNQQFHSITSLCGRFSSSSSLERTPRGKWPTIS